MITKLRSLLNIIRPLNTFQSSIAVLITASLFGNFPPLSILLLTIFVVATFLGAGNAINDYFDAEIDKINRPNRSIPLGKISKNEVLIFAIFLFLIGIFIFLNIRTTLSSILLLTNLLLLIIYTPLLKPTAFLGNIGVSYLLGSTFIFSADIFGDFQLGVIPALLAFSFNLSRELVKDIEDIQGDKTNNLKTLPILIGISNSKKIIAFLIVLIIAFCFIPYTLGIYGKFYLFVVILTVEIPLIFVLYLVLISNDKKDFSRISNLMKILVFCGLISIYLGKF